MGDKQKSHFGLIWAKAPVGRREKSKKGEKKRKERKKKEKKKKEIKRYVFIMESNVFWMSRVIGVIPRVFLWRLGCFKT